MSVESAGDITTTVTWRVERQIDGAWTSFFATTTRGTVFGMEDRARNLYPYDEFRIVESRTIETVLK